MNRPQRVNRNIIGNWNSASDEGGIERRKASRAPLFQIVKGCDIYSVWNNGSKSIVKYDYSCTIIAILNICSQCSIKHTEWNKPLVLYLPIRMSSWGKNTSSQLRKHQDSRVRIYTFISAKKGVLINVYFANSFLLEQFLCLHFNNSSAFTFKLQVKLKLFFAF